MSDTYIPVDYSQFDVAEKVSPSSDYTPVDYSQFDAEETVTDDGQEEQFTEESLNVNPQWLDYANTIYKSEEGERWKGSNKRLAEWLKNRHSEVNNDITSTGWLAFNADNLDTGTKRAWVNSMDMYENLDSDGTTFLRAAKNMVQDPSVWGSVIGTFGLGTVARLTGGRVANVAARFTLKEQMKKALAKQGIKKEAIKEFAEKGVSKGVTTEALKEARKTASKKMARLYGAESAAYTGAHSGLDTMVQQQFDEVHDNPSDQINYGEVARDALLGTALGFGFGYGPARGINHLLAKKQLRQNDARLIALEEAAEEEALETLTSINLPTIGARTAASEIETVVGREGKKLEVDGEAVIHVGTRKELAEELKKEGTKKTKKEIDEIYKETKEAIVNAGEHAGIEFEEEGVGTGLFRGLKRYSPKSVEPVAEDGRRWYTTLLGKISRRIGTAVPREVRRLTRLKEAAGNKILRGVNTRLVTLKKAVEKEFGVKKIGDLRKGVLEDLDNVLRGSPEAIAKHANKPLTLKALASMREDISILQKELLDSGMIKEGSELETTIKASMDGKSGELWLTRQYKIFDDPDWGKTLKNNPKIRKEAEDYFRKRFAEGDEGFGIIFQNASEGRILSRGDQEIYDAYMGKNGAIQQTIKNLLDSHTEEDLITAFTSPLKFREGAAGKILTKRKDIPKELRGLLGEYKDPLTNYANSLMKINQTLETYQFENSIANLIKNVVPPEGAVAGRVGAEAEDVLRTRERPEWMGSEFGSYSPEWVKRLTGREVVEQGTGESLIRGAGTRPDPATGRTVELSSVLPVRAGVRRPITEGGEEIAGMEIDFLGGSLDTRASPLDRLYANKEVADAIINGNNIAVLQQKHLQKYLLLQGHTRAAKTVWSPTAIARNFLGAGWMAAGAGYFRPSSLKGIYQVARGMSKWSDKELRKEMEKGVALGYIQSGVDLGTYREALRLGSKKEFWNGADQIYKGDKTLKDKAVSINTSAVKLYQSMDDMWKQMAFINEKNTYKKILADQFGEGYPDQVARRMRSGDGEEIIITNLDEYAADMVSRHMQNYAGVPQFVRYARLLPAADFLAFTTELMRTQTNIYGTALRDIAQGSKLLSQTGGQRGGTQLKAGLTRAGSVISVTAAGTALPYTANEIFTDLNEKEEGQPYTRKQALEFFNAPYDKGDRFIYYGNPENGEGTRVNISYINPWAKFQSPIHAGIEALNRGEDVDGKILDAVGETWFKPLWETFGPSMLAESLVNIAVNRDKYGNKLYKGSNSLAQDMTAGVLGFLEPFDPGLFRTARNIYGAYTEQPFEGAEYAMKRGKAGRKTTKENELWSLTGVKPQKYDIKIELGYRMSDLKRQMGEAGKIFTDMTQQQSPMTAEELVEGYEEALEKQFSLAKDMFDVITHAKSLGMNNKDIYKAITREGYFPKFMDKKILANLINKGVYIPPAPLRKDIFKWNEATKKRGGSPPPVREAQAELINVYKSYVGAQTGQR